MVSSGNTHHDGYTTFRSSDGALLLFSLPLLAPHSSFFEALNALPPSREIIDLDIPAAALQGILERIPRITTLTTCGETGRPVPSHFRIHYQPQVLPDPEVVSDILLALHKYDLPFLTSVLYDEAMYQREMLRPDLLYLLSVIEGEEGSTLWQTLLVCNGASKGDPNVAELLERFNLPAKHEILSRAALDWRQEHGHMQITFQAEAVRWLLHLRFSKWTKDGMWHVCPVTSDNNWQAYISVCERYALKYLCEAAARLPEVADRPVVLRDVGIECYFCSRHLEAVMDSLWLTYCKDGKCQYLHADSQVPTHLLTPAHMICPSCRDCSLCRPKIKPVQNRANSRTLFRRALLSILLCFCHGTLLFIQVALALYRGESVSGSFLIKLKTGLTEMTQLWQEDWQER